MSISTTDRDQDIFNALHTRDSEELRRLASLCKGDGEDEQADLLLDAAKRVDREDWSYDESIGN